MTSAGDRDTLASVLAKAIAGQREHERYDAPYVHDWGTRQDYRNRDRAVRTVQVDGDLDLSALADVLLASDWLTEVKAGAWKAGHGWCDDGIDGMCTHEPFDPNPYRKEDA